MDLKPALPSPSVQPPALTELIAPPRVWLHLSQAQQQRVLQTIVLVCQEFLRPTQPMPAKEGPYE